MQSNVTPNGSLWQLAPTLALCEWVRPKTLDPEAGFLSFGMLTFRSAASFNLALEAKQLRAFCDWCGQRFQDADLQFFFEAAPQFLVEAPATYAAWSFTYGGALSNLRHLLLVCQKWVPASRPLMLSAWETDGSPWCRCSIGYQSRTMW